MLRLCNGLISNSPFEQSQQSAQQQTRVSPHEVDDHNLVLAASSNWEAHSVISASKNIAINILEDAIN